MQHYKYEYNDGCTYTRTSSHIIGQCRRNNVKAVISYDKLSRLTGHKNIYAVRLMNS